MGQCCTTHTRQMQSPTSHNTPSDVAPQRVAKQFVVESTDADRLSEIGRSSGTTREIGTADFTATPMRRGPSCSPMKTVSEQLVPVNEGLDKHRPVNERLLLTLDTKVDSVCALDTADDDCRFLTARSHGAVSSSATPRVKLGIEVPDGCKEVSGVRPSIEGFLSCLSSEWNESVVNNGANRCTSATVNGSPHGVVGAGFDASATFALPTVTPSMRPEIAITASSSSSVVSSPFASPQLPCGEVSATFVTAASTPRSLKVSSFTSVLSPPGSEHSLHTVTSLPLLTEPRRHASQTPETGSGVQPSFVTAVTPSAALSPALLSGGASLVTALSSAPSGRVGRPVSAASSTSFARERLRPATASGIFSRGSSSFISAISPLTTGGAGYSARNIPPFVMTMSPSGATTALHTTFMSARSGTEVGVATVSDGAFMSCNSFPVHSSALGCDASSAANDSNSVLHHTGASNHISSLSDSLVSSRCRSPEGGFVGAQDGVSGSFLVVGRHLPWQDDDVLISLSSPAAHSSAPGSSVHSHSMEMSPTNSVTRVREMRQQPDDLNGEAVGAVLSLFVPDQAGSHASERLVGNSLAPMFPEHKSRLFSYFSRSRNPPFSFVNLLRPQNGVARPLGVNGRCGALDAGYTRMWNGKPRPVLSLPVLPTYIRVNEHAPQRRVLDVGSSPSASSTKGSSSATNSPLSPRTSNSPNKRYSLRVPSVVCE